MCFKGNIPNNWRCKGSQQTGETAQVTSSETSVLATHGTVEDNWISWCLLPKQRRWIFTKKAWQGSYQNRVSDQEKNGMSCGSLVEFDKLKDKKDCALHYCGWATLLHEVFWFMPVSPRIVDGPIWRSCKNPRENWSKEPCYNSKNNSFYLNKRRQFTWSLCWERQACSRSIHDLAHISTQNCLGRSSWRTHSAKADDLITESENWEIVGGCHTSKL